MPHTVLHGVQSLISSDDVVSDQTPRDECTLRIGYDIWKNRLKAVC